MSQIIQAVSNGSTAYTTSADFCRIFSEEMSGLYTLGFLLTADAKKAEQCFVSGIGDCVEGNAVFKEWARSWARRAIIQHAIRMIEPTQAHAGDLKTEAVLKLEPGLRAVLGLNSLERFVYVMSVLEGYSFQDCSILLGCTRQAVISARAHAIEELANAGGISAMQRDDLPTQTALLSN